MSGRTVAEIIGQTSDGNWPHDGRRLPAEVIIGWECPACGEWINEAGPRTQCPKDWRNATPSVDVMLAWLHPERAFIDSIEPETGLTPGADPADRWCIHVLYENDRDEHFTAPTLLAALEAAVRAVAGEDEQ